MLMPNAFISVIKAGKSCATRGENKCVSGASCDKDLCKCGDGYTEDGEICSMTINFFNICACLRNYVLVIVNVRVCLVELYLF